MSKVGNNVAQGASAVVGQLESGTSKFLDLLKNFNVIGFALAMVIGNNITEMSNAFIDGVVMPTIDPTIKRISGVTKKVKIGGITINLEKFFQAFMKFIALSIVIFIFINLGVQINKPVGWVRIVGEAPELNLS
jgi:large-conductance mechanosensitive channel